MSEVWTIERINQLINDDQPETLHLEYKAGAALDFRKDPERRAKLAKEVSSFANSDGGIIIYGVTEKAGIPEDKDPIGAEIISKETLEQIIHSNISPKIPGLVITPIAFNGGNIFVIEIPKGLTAHQCDNDKIYYKRYNTMSKAMDDYEVKDVINRLTTPKLTIQFC